MKTILKATFILATLFLMSCSKSDDKLTATTSKGGNITYTVDGNTTKIENGVSTAILDNETKIGDISNSDLKTRIGDGATKPFTVGTPITGQAITIQINGLQWVRKATANTMIITSYDGTTVKGTFSGQVANNSTGTFVYKNISGTFETNDITKF
jgi:hypothetical protein